MNEERDHLSPGDTQGALGGADDEPTLETGGHRDDEEPTLETEGGGSSEKRAEAEVRSRSADGWGSRLERMTAAKKARRRRLIGRFWLAAVPVLLLVAMAMVLLAVYGGQNGNDSGSATTTVTAVRTADEGSALLLVSNDGELVVGALMHPWERGGVVLAIPGVTLLETEGVFQELRVTYQGGGPQAVKATLADALDMPIGPAAVAEWSELVIGLQLVVGDDTPIEVMATSQGEIVAQVVRDTIAGQGGKGSSGGWSDVPLSGETASFLDAIAIDAESMVNDVWSADTLRGTVVDGDGFWYLEPDIVSARTLLFVNDDPVMISVEIRDGAGLEGAARTAGALFEDAGFELAPMSYAEGYPGVEKTQIMISEASAAEAQQIRSLLGVGDIVVDAALADDVVVVVLGRDYGVEPVTTTLPSSEAGE